MNRRKFLLRAGAGAAALTGSCNSSPALLAPGARGVAQELAKTDGEPDEIARDEDFWRHAQDAFTVDRSMVNFNNGGVSPSPQVVQESLARNLAYANSAPSYTMWRVQEPEKEAVRSGLAQLFGVDSEEIAITRNATESLQTCQFGFDLPRGAVVLACDQDYPRMLNTFKQRERREGIELEVIELPPPEASEDAVVRCYTDALDEKRPSLLLLSHMIYLTGRVLPVARIVAEARTRGVPTIVDGAHAFAHLVFRQEDLGCDYYAASLHKWLFAPFGTGLLYVKQDRIADLWPLMAASEAEDEDIRKFEQIGTHSVPVPLAIGDAMQFHQLLGPERKLARLLYLRERWTERIADTGNARFRASLAPGGAGGFVTVEIPGVDPSEIHQHLWSEHRIYTVAILQEGASGLRVSPSVYSTLEEVDRFADILAAIARNGIPA